MSMRTPLAKVRGLGSAREGTVHFWRQRVTAFMLIFLVLYAVWLAVGLVGADHAAVRAALARPINAVALLLLLLAGVYHMWLGMQVIIEDYVQGEGGKMLALVLNTAFSSIVAISAALAILKLSFGA